MKILQVIDALSPAGAEVVVCQLSRALRELGLDTEIYALRRTGSWLETECQKNGIPVHYARLRSVYSPRHVLELHRHLRASQYDLVHVHLFPAQLWAAMAAALPGWKGPLIATEHSTKNRRRNWLFRRLDTWMYRRYNVVVTVSQAASQALRAWIPSMDGRIKTIHNGVRLAEIAQVEACDLKHLLAIREDLLAISVGRCVAIKNHHCSIRAVSKTKGLHLAIVGDGTLLPDLRAFAESLHVSDRVHFLGQRNDVVALLKGSDIYVQASRWEGFSMAAGEAVAAGLPVLISNVPGLRDVVADAALTFESDDDEQLARLLARLQTEPGLRERLAAASRSRARDLDLSTTTQAYADVYRSSLGARTPHAESTHAAPPERSPAIGESLRILSVVTRFGAGGPPLNVLHLARGMEKYGYQTVIAAGACASQDADMSYLLTDQDKVEWVPSMSRDVSPAADLIALWELIRLVRKYKPDIIHTHTAKAGVLGRLAGWVNGTPLIVHTFHGNVLRGYFNAFGSWCVQKIEQMFGVISDALIVISCQQQQEIAGEFAIADAKKVRVLPLGLPLKDFAALPPPPPHRNEFVVAWFGRLVKVKNIPLLVQVVHKSLAAIPNIRFVIAGDGPERATIEKLVESSDGRVEYLGWQRDVIPVMARADLLIQTSINEGTPTILIQGMAASRPFISTAVGGVGDMVAGEKRVENGASWFDNGVLVGQAADSFLSALRTFAANRALLSQMGMVGRQWSLSNYSESKMLAATHQIYSEYLSSKGHRVLPPLPADLAAEVSMTEQLSRLAGQTGASVPAELKNTNERGRLAR